MKSWIIALLFLCTSCASIVETGPVVDSEKGIVVCVDSYAAKVGIDILDRGGNAFDAAIATAFSLAVTHPQAGNLGGGGFMMIRTRDGLVTSIDYRERAPIESTPKMFLKPDGTIDKVKANYSFMASGVPGTVAGLYLAHTHYGSMDWHELLEPACVLAERGFRVDSDLARALFKHEKNLRRFPTTVKVFFKPNGDRLGVGDRLVQKNLGRTLRAIQSGGQDGFYKGSVANELIRAVEEDGGIMTNRDLETYYAKERDPMLFKYKGIDIYSMGLPSSGGIVLSQMLNILYGYDLKTMTPTERAHLLAEIMRRAFKDRALHLGDPDTTKPPLDLLLSYDYAMSLRKKIRLDSITPSKSLAPDMTIHPAPKKEDKVNEQGTGQTTHFCIADKHGNIVSNTYTLEQTFGCKGVAGSTGVLMNNEMHDFNLRPGWTSESGAIGTDPNLIAPGKRMLSSMCPVILMKDGAPFAAFGSPGGRTIINTVFQVLINIVDLDMSMEEAIIAPRIHHQWYPEVVYVEKKTPITIKEALKNIGHKIKEVDFIGDCHGLFFPSWNLTGNVKGVADQRIDGCAAGLF